MVHLEYKAFVNVVVSRRIRGYQFVNQKIGPLHTIDQFYLLTIVVVRTSGRGEIARMPTDYEIRFHTPLTVQIIQIA